MKFTRFLALTVAFAIAGCAKEAPKCSDEQTLNLAKELFAKQLTEFAAKLTGTQVDPKQAAEKLRFEYPRASNFDEKIKKYACEATLVDSDGRQMAVKYTSQLNDQGEHLVFVPGLSETVGAALMQGIFAAPTAAPQDRTQPAPPAKVVVPDLSKYLGQSPGSIFNEPFLDQQLKALLGNDQAEYDHFMANLTVSSGIEEKGGFYFGEGIAPHLGSIEEAAFAIDKSTGKVFIAVLMEGKTIKWGGVKSDSDLPPPLLTWHKEHGG